MVGDIAHVCNRGFKKHNIFLDNGDYLRFVLNLYRLNNKKGSLRITNHKNPFDILPEQDKLVEILKWSLMPNHYHLLLYEKVDGGILEFVKRSGNSYTKYVNIKYSSSGYVFQNSAKIIPINHDSQYLYIPFYIDLNSIDLMSNLKRGNFNKRQTLDWLYKYSWSSSRDYFGKVSKFLPIINKKLFYELFDSGPEAYQEEMLRLLEEDNFSDLYIDLPGRHV